jgi:hypothetical protein
MLDNIVNGNRKNGHVECSIRHEGQTFVEPGWNDPNASEVINFENL